MSALRDPTKTGERDKPCGSLGKSWKGSIHLTERGGCGCKIQKKRGIFAAVYGMSGIT
jgi:hypothetical protein